MLIQSRKNPERVEEISLETWNGMKLNGLDKKFRVLSSLDIGPGNIPVPVDVENFMNSKQEIRVEKIYEDPEAGRVFSDEEARDTLINDLKGQTKAQLIEQFPDIDINETMLKVEIIDKIINR